MTHTIELVNVHDRTALARDLLVEESQLGHAIGSAMDAQYGFIRASGLEPMGRPFVIYRDRLADDRWSVGVFAPIAEAPDTVASEDLLIEHLAAGLVAQTVHHGRYETIGDAYDDMARWMGENGYAPAGPPRETYLSETSAPPTDVATLVQVPVERVG